MFLMDGFLWPAWTEPCGKNQQRVREHGDMFFLNISLYSSIEEIWPFLGAKESLWCRFGF